MSVRRAVAGFAAELSREAISLSRLIRTPTRTVTFDNGSTVAIWGLNERNAEIVDEHLHEQFEQIKSEQISSGLDRHLNHVSRIEASGDGKTGRHQYDPFRGVELAFVQPVHSSTLCHEFGHTIASAGGYTLPSHSSGEVAEKYNGRPPNWDFESTSISRDEFMFHDCYPKEKRVPGLAEVEEYGLNPTADLSSQDWLPVDPGEPTVADYVRVRMGKEHTAIGRVLNKSVNRDEMKIRDVSGEVRDFDPWESTVEMIGYVPGFDCNCDGKYESSVDRLIAAINKAWYRMTVEQEVGMQAAVIGSPYSMTNAHETMAKTHELFQGEEKYRREDGETASMSEEFPEVHRAYREVVEPEVVDPIVMTPFRGASDERQPEAARPDSILSLNINIL